MEDDRKIYEVSCIDERWYAEGGFWGPPLYGNSSEQKLYVVASSIAAVDAHFRGQTSGAYRTRARSVKEFAPVVVL